MRAIVAIAIVITAYYCYYLLLAYYYYYCGTERSPDSGATTTCSLRMYIIAIAIIVIECCIPYGCMFCLV